MISTTMKATTVTKVTTSWIGLLAIILVVQADNLALLSGTLRTFQRAGCDDEVVTLKCPSGTSISIEVAQYGKSAPSKSLCGLKASQSTATLKPPSPAAYNVSCLWPNALQRKWDEVAEGSWGRTVVEACQKKRQCKFRTSPKTFGGDPCPGVRKYVEVAYKCRPYEFRSKEACQNDRIQLKCNPNSRVAIFSASYGRTKYDSIQCPQPAGVPEETCLVSYASEIVMHRCHGKRFCALSADIDTFGSSCRPDSRMYLKVVYTCVPRKVLKDEYVGQLETDEVDDQELATNDDDDFDAYDAGNEFIREAAASPETPSNAENDGNKENNLTKANVKSPPHKSNGFNFEVVLVPESASTRTLSAGIKMPSSNNCTEPKPKRAVGFVSDWINAYTFLSQNQEKLYLYLIVSVAAGVLLCMTILIGRLLVQRHKARREAKFHATNVAEQSLPNGFTDDISEVDADIDLATPLPTMTIHTGGGTVSSIAEVVRYPQHTLRRPYDTSTMAASIIDVPPPPPRSLSGGTTTTGTGTGGHANTQYYYG